MLVKRLLPLNPIGWLGQTIALSKYHLGNSEKQHFASAQALCTWNLDKFITFTMARPWKLWEWCLDHRRKSSRLPYFSLHKWLVVFPTSTLKKTLKNTPTHTGRRQYTSKRKRITLKLIEDLHSIFSNTMQSENEMQALEVRCLRNTLIFLWQIPRN